MHSQAELVFREGPTRDFMKGGSRQRRTLTRVVEKIDPNGTGCAQRNFTDKSIIFSININQINVKFKIQTKWTMGKKMDMVKKMVTFGHLVINL